MNFKQLVGQYALNRLVTEALPDIAYEGLKEGFDSPSLVMLAGIEKNENAFIIEQYFKAALSELRIDIPDKRTAALEYATIIAEEIIEGKRGLFEGVREIVYKILVGFGFSSKDVNYDYDSIFFKNVYGWFDSYDELLVAKHAWSDKKSNEELLEEVKEKLFEELKEWNEKMKEYLYWVNCIKP